MLELVGPLFDRPQIITSYDTPETVIKAADVCLESTRTKGRSNLFKFHSKLIEIGLQPQSITNIATTENPYDNFYFHILDGTRILIEHVNKCSNRPGVEAVRMLETCFLVHDAIEDLPTAVDRKKPLREEKQGSVYRTFNKLIDFLGISPIFDFETNRDGFISLATILICSKDPKALKPNDDTDDMSLMNSLNILLAGNNGNVVFDPSKVDILKKQIIERMRRYKLFNPMQEDFQRVIENGINNLSEEDFLLALSNARKVKLTDRLQSLSKDLEIWEKARKVSGVNYVRDEYPFGFAEGLAYAEKTEILLRKMYMDRGPDQLSGELGVDELEINLYESLLDIINRLKEEEIDLISQYAEEKKEARSGHNDEIIEILMQYADFKDRLPYQVKYLVAVHDLIQHTLEDLEQNGRDLSDLVEELKNRYPRIFTQSRLRTAHMGFALAACISANGVEQESEIWRQILTEQLLDQSETRPGLITHLVEYLTNLDKERANIPLSFFRYQYDIGQRLKRKVNSADIEVVRNRIRQEAGWESYFKEVEGIVVTRINRLMEQGIVIPEKRDLMDFIIGLANKSSGLEFQKYAKYLRSIELPAIDTNTLIQVAEFYDLESIVVKAAETVVNLNNRKTETRELGTTWRDAQELVTFYAPLLKIIGFDEFSRYCYDVAYQHIYINGFGEEQLPEETEKIQEIIGIYEQQRKEGEFLYELIKESLIPDLIPEVSRWLENIGLNEDEKVAFLRAINPRNLRCRIKSLCSAVKKLRSPNYTNSVNYRIPDLFGLKILLPEQFCDNTAVKAWPINLVSRFTAFVQDIMLRKYSEYGLQQGHTKDPYSIEILWGDIGYKQAEIELENGKRYVVLQKSRKGSNYQAAHTNFINGLELQLLSEKIQRLKFADDGQYKSAINRGENSQSRRRINNLQQQILATGVERIRRRVAYGLFNPETGSRLVIVNSKFRDYLKKTMHVDTDSRSVGFFNGQYFNIQLTDEYDPPLIRREP